MEIYNVSNHLFYDGYDIDNKLLKNKEFIKKLLETINESVFDGKGKIDLVPYFNGKVKNDGGISGLILGDNFHFTCHTFSFKNTVFVDYYGDDNKKSIVKNILFSTFDTKNYDMGNKNIQGNFGKHIIFKTEPLLLNEAVGMIKAMLLEINMTPINEVIINSKSEDRFDVLQLIAESHISFHRVGNKMVVDAFSCKNFDVKRLLKMFVSTSNYIEVNRGIKNVK